MSMFFSLSLNIVFTLFFFLSIINKVGKQNQNLQKKKNY